MAEVGQKKRMLNRQSTIREAEQSARDRIVTSAGTKLYHRVIYSQRLRGAGARNVLICIKGLRREAIS